MATFADINKLTDNYASTRTYTEADIENILFPQSGLSESLASADMTVDLQRRFKRLSQKRSRYTLHGSTLSEYVRSKRIPRGLRIQKVPTLGRHDPEFCEQWCQILNKASLDLTVLVIEHTKKRLSSLETEIGEITSQLESVTPPEDFTKLKEEMKSAMDRYEAEIMKQKLSTFRRDTMDYKTNNIYPWLKENAERPRRRVRFGDVHTSESSASEFLTDSEGDFLDHPRANRDTRPPHPQADAPQRPGGAGGRAKPQGRGAATHNNQPTRWSSRPRKKTVFY